MPKGPARDGDTPNALIGTARESWLWMPRTVNAQALPAVNYADVLSFDTPPASKYTNTVNTFIVCPLNPHDLVRLRFLGDHGTAAASKSGSARFWLAERSRFFEIGDFHEHNGRHLFSATLACSASPALVPSTSKLAISGSQVGHIDAITISDDDSIAGVRKTGDGLELMFDAEGAGFLIGAFSIGTFVGLRMGLRQL